MLTDRRYKRSLAVIFSLSFLVQLAMSPTAGYDLGGYKYWEQAIGQRGVLHVYGHARSPVVYPPVYPLFLTPISLLYRPPAGRINPADRWFSILMKFPMIVLNLAVGMVLLYLGRKLRYRNERILLGAAAYLLNPAVIFITGWQGLIDPLLGILALSAFAALLSGRWLLSGFLSLLVPLTKPQGTLVVPPLFFTSLARGTRPLIRWMIGAALSVVAVMGPFLLAGTLADVLRVPTVGHYPYISMNAHNLWWLVDVIQHNPRISDERVLFGLPWLMLVRVASVATLCSVLLVNGRLYRFFSLQGKSESDTERAMTVASAMILSIFSYFALSTEVHENHLYLAMPFLCVLIMARGLRLIDLILILSWTSNVVIHDGSFVEILHTTTAHNALLHVIYDQIVSIPDHNANNSVSWITGLSAAINVVIFFTYWIQYWQQTTVRPTLSAQQASLLAGPS